MANREIKTTLKLEGEQQFRQKMNDAAKAVKVLNSEEKVATAQFKATGDAQQYAADRARIYKEKIAEQEKAVKAAEEAVKKLTEQGFSRSSREVQQWTVKLNSAKAQLITMQSGLSNAEAQLSGQADAMSGAADAADDYGAAIANIDRGINFQTTLEALDRVEQRLTKLTTAAANAAKALWSAEIDAGKWADETITDSIKYGLSPEELQRWRYAATQIDTDVEDIIKSQDKLQKAVYKGKDEDLKVFNALGVSTRGENQELRNSIDLFWDTVEALGAYGDEVQADAYAQQLFGKSYRDLLPLIQAGRSGWEAAAADATVVSEDDVRNLGAFDDNINKMTNALDTLKYSALAGISTGMTAIASGFTDAAKAFQDFLSTDEGQQALQTINDALSGLGEKIAGIDWSGVFESVSKAISLLAESLGWIIDHAEAVVIALGAIKTAVAGIKVGKDLLSLTNGFKGLVGGKAASAIAGGGGSAASAVASTAGSGAFYGMLKSALSSALTTAAPALTGIAAGTGLNYVLDRAYVERAFGEYNRLIEQGATGSLAKQLTDMGDMSDSDAYDAFLRLYKEAPEFFKGELGMPAWLDEIDQLETKPIMDVLELMGQAAVAAEEYEKSGGSLPETLAASITDGVPSLQTAVQAAMDAITSTIVERGNQAIAAAANVAAGINSALGGAASGGVAGATIVMDSTIVGRLVTPSVDRTLGAQIGGRR